MKRAFSLIELILVIVILSIISGIGINLMLVLYKNYNTNKTISELNIKSELTLDYIDKLLAIRIPQSTIARNSNSMEFVSLSNIKPNKEYDMLEFVTYAKEAFNAGYYSGFADLNQSNARQGLKTPQSNLIKLKDNIKEINNKFNPNIFDLAVFFTTLPYNPQDIFNKNGSINLAIARIKDNETLELKNLRQDRLISEHYHIAHSAYGIRMEPSISNNGKYDLIFYYNYRPWSGENFKNANRALLAKNVSAFNFRANQDIVELKLCLSNSTDNIVCKSKVVQ